MDKVAPDRQSASPSPSPSPPEAAEPAPIDPEFVSCLLQPPFAHNDPDYVGTRRLLLRRKQDAEISHRKVTSRLNSSSIELLDLADEAKLDRLKDWRCNGRGYVAYRNFIRRPRNWESAAAPSPLSTPSNSGRWASTPAPQSILFEAESRFSSRDLRGGSQSFSHRTSFSSSTSDADRQIRFVEPAYSFVGMHCIFDNCKASVTILKFGHMSSDILACGASDGSLTIYHVSETPSVLQQLRGHSKAITVHRFILNG